MAFDSDRVAARLKEKVSKEKEGGAEDKGEGEEPSDTSPGRMALRAIKAGDAEALEEAIRACVEKSY